MAFSPHTERLMPPPLRPVYGVRGLRAKTLIAAAAILAESSVEEMSLRAIAEKAGIGIASIYYYFRNKEELLLDLTVMGFEELRQNILGERATGDVPDPVGAAARAFFGFAASNPSLFQLMYNERFLLRHERLRGAERETFLTFQTAVESDARFPPELHDNLALALWALGRGIAATISSQPAGRLSPEAEKIWAGVNYLVSRTRIV